MVFFRAEVLSSAITRIHTIGTEQMYLVKGKERAALIDTGSGVGDLKAFVRTLTDLPLIVLITHGHGDHAWGAGQFEEGFISFLDKDIFIPRENADRSRYLTGDSLAGRISAADIHPVAPPKKLHDLKEGDVFDLGGIHIDVYNLPGHSAGSRIFLIPEERVLITGDACNYFTFLQGPACLGVRTYQNNLRRVKEILEGRYEAILLSHGKLTPPITLLDEVLEICQSVLDGTDDKAPYDFHGVCGYAARAFGTVKDSPYGVSSYLRLDGGFGNIVYNPERIRE